MFSNFDGDGSISWLSRRNAICLDPERAEECQ